MKINSSITAINNIQNYRKNNQMQNIKSTTCPDCYASDYNKNLTAILRNNTLAHISFGINPGRLDASTTALVMTYMRSGFNYFPIREFGNDSSTIRAILERVIPELRTRCSDVEQYKAGLLSLLSQLRDFFRDNIYDMDMAEYLLRMTRDIVSAIDNADRDFNTNRQQDSNAETPAPAEPQPKTRATTTEPERSTAAGTSQILSNKALLSDIPAVNDYLFEIAAKYAKSSGTSTMKGPFEFEPPVTNELFERRFLRNSSGSANEIFAEAVLESARQESDVVDSTLLKLIQKRGFDPNYQYSGGYNVGCRPVFILTTLNKPYLLQEILKLRSADPNLVNGSSLTPLVRAAMTNSLDCAYVLLKSGKLNNSEVERCKLLSNLSPEMRGLLNSYPNTDEYINSTYTNLAKLEKINIKTLEDVMRIPNVDVKFTDSNGNNILHIASMLKDYEESLKIAANAIGLKVDINKANNNGETPLLIALKNKNYDLVAFLIEKGADLSTLKDELNNSFTHIIISVAEEEEAIKFLDLVKEKGVSMDLQNCSGVTPFIQAVKLRKYKIIKYLLANGVIANKADRYGRTPLHYACILNDPTSLELLLNNFVNTKTKDVSGKLACEYLTKPELINFYRMFDGMF